jgi:hypothetical protein
MKLWILSHLKDSPGNRLAEDAARRMGHPVTLVDPLRAHLLRFRGAPGPGQPRAG